MKATKKITASLLLVALLFSTTLVLANQGQVVDINPVAATATVEDCETGEIVRVLDVDPALGVGLDCIVDYFNPTEQEERMGMVPVINFVITCGR